MVVQTSNVIFSEDLKLSVDHDTEDIWIMAGEKDSRNFPIVISLSKIEVEKLMTQLQWALQDMEITA